MCHADMKQAPALRFAKELAARQMPFFLRYVYVPGLTDAPDDIDRLIDFAAAQVSHFWSLKAS